MNDEYATNSKPAGASARSGYHRLSAPIEIAILQGQAQPPHTHSHTINVVRAPPTIVKSFFSCKIDPA